MDLFANTIYREILEVFKDNSKLKSRLDFLSKYRHDEAYVQDIAKRLNKDKEDIYVDCLVFTTKLMNFVDKNSTEVANEITEENLTRSHKISKYGKEFMDRLCKRVHDQLEKEGDLI